jgi:hypothetical protein
MPLDHGYGVVTGTFASFTREDPSDFGHWYHGKLRVDTPAGPYEAALDVDTPSGVGVSYRVVTDLSVTDLPVIASLSSGFHALASDPSSGALDYVRSPLLRDGSMLDPPSCRSFPWVASDGDNALDVLEPLVRGAARIHVFGEPYTTGLGVHNAHCNQGDPPGPHQGEDGIWQDGAVLTQTSGGAVTIWQVRFNTQSLHTDDHGLPV